MERKIVSICSLIIEYGFYALFFFTPLLFTRVTYELFEFPKMLFVYGAATIVAAAYIIKSLMRKKIVIRRSLLDLPILLLFTSNLLSTFLSIDKYTSFFGYYTRFHGGLLSLLSYLGLYYIFISEFDFKRRGRTLLYTISFSTAVITLYALLQRLGIDKQYWVQDSQARVFSTLGQPNWLAAYLAMVIPLLLAQVFLDRKKRTRLFFCLLTLFSLLAFYFTFSRSGFLGLFPSLAIFFLFARSATHSKNLRPLLLLAFLLIGVFAVPPNQISGRLRETAKDINISEGSSTVGIRLLVWKGTLNLFFRSDFERKIFGYGPGTFAYAFLPFRPKELNRTAEWNFLYNKPHNELLDTLTNTGILGVLAFIGLTLVYSLWNIEHLTKKPMEPDKRLFLLAIFSGWLSLLVTSFFGFLVVSTTFLFWLFPALSFSISDQPPKGKKDINLPARPLSLIGTLLCLSLLFCILKIFQADVTASKGEKLKQASFYEPASRYLKEAVELNPKEPRYVRELAQTYAALAQISPDREAEQMYTEQADEQARIALKLNPHNFLTIRSVINTYLELGRVEPTFLEQAERVVNFAIDYVPTDPALRLIKGKILMTKGERAAALFVFNEALDLKSDYEEAKYAKGLVLADLGFYEEATKIMEELGRTDKAEKYREILKSK